MIPAIWDGMGWEEEGYSLSRVLDSLSQRHREEIAGERFQCSHSSY